MRKKLLKNGEDVLLENFYALKTREDIANLLEITESTLIYYLYRKHPIDNYTVFEIPKKSQQGKRKIAAPITPLKIIQQKLNEILQCVYHPKSPVHSFIRSDDKRSILTNARQHFGKRFVFNIDLEDFYHSINFGRVRGLFLAPPYGFNNLVATTLAQLCIFDNQLPQGAPTSPIISNMICARLDSQLLHLAKQYQCIYTRYADDITFSTSYKSFPLAVAKNEKGIFVPGVELTEIIESNGFKINQSKVRLQNRSYQRQVVTGLIVNNAPNVGKELLQQIRAMLYVWEKFGLENAQREFEEKYIKKHRGGYHRNEYPAFEKVLRGKIDFLGYVRGKDNPKYIKFMNLYENLFYGSIQNAVWVIETEIDDDNLNQLDDFSQGTAFFLDKYGLITCHHVIETPLFNNMKSFQPPNVSEKSPLRKKTSHQHFDLAILEFDALVKRKLFITHRSIEDITDDRNIGEEVTLMGFPNYHLGSSITIKSGKIASFRNIHGIRWIVISPAIVAGNSGGPVLDKHNRVIGVAAQGIKPDESEDKTDFFGVIPIHYLDAFFKK